MRNLNCHNLFTSLNSLCKFLDDTYNVNSGGCCFLASLIAKHLDRLKVSYELVIYDYNWKDRISIEHEVLSRHRNEGPDESVTGRYSCNHYCICIKGAGIVNQLNDEGEYQYLISDVSYKNIKWLYKVGDWNSCYEVRHNKTIRNIVKEFFREYE